MPTETIHSIKRVFVFGNPDLPDDALPLLLLPALREAFPNVSFEVLDPHEEWDVPRHMVIIDTVVNATEITVFHNLSVFTAAPRVTCHDFDAYANLLLLKKLGKIDRVTIIGLPPGPHKHVDMSTLSAHIAQALAPEMPA